MTPLSLYWHDYETFGTDPRLDRPAQFAGLRTDADFQTIGEPLVVYCRPPADYLPQPEACLLTGITPQLAAQNGVCEARFTALLHEQLAWPGTCALGYNSLRFDDEVTRNLLYRNFFDPYAREWQNGNSRWDVLDWARAAYAWRPDGVNWPCDGDGKPSFKLEALTAANGIAHTAAHDALADVRATLAFAKLLRDAQPKLYAYLFANRSKHAALELLQLGSMQPLLHVSGMYPAERGGFALVLPLCRQPGMDNGVLVYDTAHDPQPLLDLDAEAIRQRLFTAQLELPPGVARIPIKAVHVNKCPVLAPLSVLRPQDVERWGLDIGACQRHAQRLAAHFVSAAVADKLRLAYARDFASVDDPDLLLYGGGFFGPGDRRAMDTIRATAPERLAALMPQFADARLPEMLFRYRARNYPETLNAFESRRWRGFCAERLAVRHGAGIADYLLALDALAEQSGSNRQTLQDLRQYAMQLWRNCQ